MGLNLFNGCKKLKEVRNRLLRYLSHLKGCCLLQDGNEMGMIKMHDVVHKFASSMAFNNHNVFSVANDDELEEWPSKDELEHFSAISLPECHLPPDQMLPTAFDNPKLESFLLLRSEIDTSFQIPDNFFVGMKGLKLMDLTCISLSPVLVSSFEVLVKLRTLCLDGCELSDISVIGELPMLQVLSLVASSIILIPKEIGKLGSTLKLLDLRRCEKLKRIAAGVIFKLNLLEDLRIGDSFKGWEPLEGGNKSIDIVDDTNEEEMASMKEFKNLRNLINLEIEIPDGERMFPQDLVFSKLETFKILFGVCWWSKSDDLSTRILKMGESCKVVDFDSVGIKALITRVDSISLCFVNASEMGSKDFSELKYLQVKYEYGIQYIIKKNNNNRLFTKLETLELICLSKLEICDDLNHPLPIGSFENLRSIKVGECKLLKHLLSSNLARGLLRLKEMSIKQCEIMESIIFSRECENEEEIQIGFTHQLRVLELHDLPRLVSLCNFKQTEEAPSLITPLFNKKIVFPNLEVLDLCDIKSEKLWGDHFAITAGGICWHQNLTRLKVYNCQELSYLFTSSMVKSFAQLKEVEVSYCESMEEIFATMEGEMGGEKLLSFPKLEYLRLSHLRKLKRFCHANLFECQSLQKLNIMECPMLNTFIGGNESSQFDEKIIFPKLEMLKIEKIWDFNHIAITAQETTCWFQNLTRLDVGWCNNLSYLFTSSTVKSLAKLKQLEVSKCKSIEEIVASTTGDVQLSFPKLDNIALKGLLNLKRFCHANLLECPLLRKLVIIDCPDLRTFMSTNDFSSPDNSTILFTEKVAFPNMEELKIANCDKIDLFGFNGTQQLNVAFVKVISNLKSCHLYVGGGLSLNYRHQQFKLKIVDCGPQFPSTLFALLKCFSRLDKFVVSRSSIIQLFPCESDHLAAAADSDDMDTHARTFARIGHLKLTMLSNMKQIWSEHSPLKYHVIPEILDVFACDNLLSLAPPSTILFKNLTALNVWSCPMLIRLVTSSSATKSLVNLEKMNVTCCDSLEEIVIINDQWEELANIDEYIIFEKLKSLELDGLESLTSFCSTSNCNFQFPLLNRVIVENCPKMKCFSKGALRTPKLIRVWPSWVKEEDEEKQQNEARWEGDLNSTIQMLFEEKVTRMVEDEMCSYLQ